MEQKKERLKHLSGKDVKADQLSEVYSHFIKRMRLILPICLLILFIALITWPQLENALPDFSEELTDIDLTEARNTLIAPRFESLDRALRPYVITAEEAEFQNLSQSDIILKSPKGELQTSTLKKLNISAESGRYNRNKETLTLDDHVIMTHSDGYTLKGSNLYFDMKLAQAHSNQPIKIETKDAVLRAPGASITKEGQHILFFGPATIYFKGN